MLGLFKYPNGWVVELVKDENGKESPAVIYPPGESDNEKNRAIAYKLIQCWRFEKALVERWLLAGRKYLEGLEVKQ